MTTSSARAAAALPAEAAASAVRVGAGRVEPVSALAAASPPVGLPAELVAVDEAMRAALRVAGGADRWPAAMRANVLVWVGRQRDVLAVLEGKVLTAERNAGTWSLRGDRDLAGFVGRTARTGRGAGMAAVGQAGTLAAMPVVADALVDGPVTSTHVAQITRATAASPVLAAELATPAGQAQLVQLAGRLDGGEFGKALAQLSASLDPASRQQAHDEQRANRSFAWTHTPSGTLVKGRLDSVAGHQLAKAIDALCPRPAAEDDRSREMRQADALLALVERAATDKTTTPGALAPVQAIVTFTQDTWTALRAGQEEAEGSVPGSTLGVLDRLRGLPPVTDETGQPWPASEVARALCDCALTRAVLGAGDVELNLGRDARAFTRRHWLALYAAGVTGCQIPGCGMPLAYCQLHHLAWWHRDNGATTLTNCAAYCSFHHHEIHRLGIQITRRADGSLQHHHPDGRPYGGAPRRDTATPAATAEATSSREIARPQLEPATVRTDRSAPGTAPPGRPPRSSTAENLPSPPRDTRQATVGTTPGTIGTTPGTVDTTAGTVGTTPGTVGTTPGTVDGPPGTVDTPSDRVDGTPRSEHASDASPGRATTTAYRDADGPPTDLITLLDLLSA